MLISVLFCYCIVIHEGILELYVNLTKTLSGNDLSFSWRLCDPFVIKKYDGKVVQKGSNQRDRGLSFNTFSKTRANEEQQNSRDVLSKWVKNGERAVLLLDFFCHIHLIILIISTFSFISIFVNLWREVTNDDKLKFYIATWICNTTCISIWWQKDLSAYTVNSYHVCIIA